MGAPGEIFGNKTVSRAKTTRRGLAAIPDTGFPSDSCTFEIITGSTALPDIQFTAGITVILAIADVPLGMKCYIEEIKVYASTVFAGGTAGTVSLTIEDTAGTDIATFTQTALSANTLGIQLPLAAAVTGVTDTLCKTLGPCTAVNQGIQVLTANSTSGVARIQLRGYFAP